MKRIPRITFFENHLEAYVESLNDNNIKKILFSKLLENLEISIKKGRKSCNICYVGEHIVVVPESDFGNVLSVLEDYFLEKEEYDKCTKARDLKLLL